MRPEPIVQDAGLAFGGGHRFLQFRSQIPADGEPRLAEGQPQPARRVRLGAQRGRAVPRCPGSGEITVFRPSVVRQEAPQIPLPASFTTVEDILQLPLRSVSITVGPGTILWRDFRDERLTDLYRLYFGDTWRAAPRLTVNYGLGWSYEPNALSHDLTKPALLTPILGAEV